MAICSTLHAGHWKTAHKSGSTWIVTATSPTKCGFAEKAGALLTHMKVDSSGNFSKTPKGYVCAGTPYGGSADRTSSVISTLEPANSTSSITGI